MLRLRVKILISFFCTLLPSTALADPKPIHLGYLLDLSAKGAFIGQQSQAGAELAVRELAAAGVDISVIFEDHRTDAKSGVTGARKLLSVDDVDAVLCDLTPPCITASPIVAAAKKIFIYQAPVVSILTANPYAFKNFLDYEEGCRRIASYWKENGIARVAHFKVNAEFGELCLRGARKVFPSQDELEYDANDDLRSLVTRLKSLDVQRIVQTGYEADYISRFRATADIGLLLPTGMPQPLLTQTVIKAVNPSALEGTIVFGFPPISEEFVNRLKAADLYRSATSIESAAIAYLHVKQLVSAVSACPRRDIDCEVKHLATSAADPILGFDGWDGRIASYDYKLRKWTNGKFQDINTK